jgi:hypothetical protein
MKFFLLITFYLLQLSFGSENSGTTFVQVDSEITTSMLRKELVSRFFGIKADFKKGPSFYIESILKDVNSKANYVIRSHLRGIFEKITDIEELKVLSDFYFKLLKYLEMSLFEQFRKIHHPNSNLTHFNTLPMSPILQENVRHCEWAHATLLTINFALLKARLGLITNEWAKTAISRAVVSIETRIPADRGIEFTREIIEQMMTTDDKIELNYTEKVAFGLFLLHQKNLLKQTLDCIQQVFKPERKELVGNPYVIYPHSIDGLIYGYQLDEVVQV